MNERDDCSLTTATNPPTNEEKYNHLDEKQQISPFKLNSISLSFDLNTIDEKHLHQTREIYCKQCPSLTTNYSIQEQKSMFQLLSIGRKNNYPLLLNLINCYLRDRLHYFMQHPKTEINISPQQWCTNSQIIKVLLYKMTKEKSQIIKDMILSAMQTYFTRYCRPMTLPTSYIIRDSIKSFTHCLHQIGTLITNIRKNPRQTFPLQIELIIIPRHVIDIHNDEYASDSDNEDDFENKTDVSESEWEDDSSVEGEEPIPRRSKWPYEIDKIGLQLRKNEINYEHDTKTIAETEFSGLYSKYAASVIPAIDKEKRDDDRINISNLSKDIHAFPHKRRLCIIVDRRTPDDANDQKNNEDEKNNEIYLFEPKECNKMPDNYVKEWYIESSYKCIISRRNGNITSKTSLDGWINVFSFHIEQEDEIKCYFYRCGQMVRFMANDIKDLFMKLFDVKRYKNNKEYVNSKEIESDIQIMKNILKDIHFDKFREVFQ